VLGRGSCHGNSRPVCNTLFSAPLCYICLVIAVISVILGLSYHTCGLPKCGGKECRQERSRTPAAFSSSATNPVCADGARIATLSF